MGNKRFLNRPELRTTDFTDGKNLTMQALLLTH
jgi:hypothetical protein